MHTPLSAKEVLDRYFLETRGRILEIAANLDRIDRGEPVAKQQDDPRMDQILQALDVLRSEGAARAERCQMVFSLPYEENWSAPNAE